MMTNDEQPIRLRKLLIGVKSIEQAWKEPILDWWVRVSILVWCGVIWFFAFWVSFRTFLGFPILQATAYSVGLVGLILTVEFALLRGRRRGHFQGFRVIYLTLPRLILLVLMALLAVLAASEHLSKDIEAARLADQEGRVEEGLTANTSYTTLQDSVVKADEKLDSLRSEELKITRKINELRRKVEVKTREAALEASGTLYRGSGTGIPNVANCPNCNPVHRELLGELSLLEVDLSAKQQELETTRKSLASQEQRQQNLRDELKKIDDEAQERAEVLTAGVTQSLNYLWVLLMDPERQVAAAFIIAVLTLSIMLPDVFAFIWTGYRNPAEQTLALATQVEQIGVNASLLEQFRNFRADDDGDSAPEADDSGDPKPPKRPDLVLVVSETPERTIPAPVLQGRSHD